jgi:hypothetical protein
VKPTDLTSIKMRVGSASNILSMIAVEVWSKYSGISQKLFPQVTRGLTLTVHMRKEKMDCVSATTSFTFARSRVLHELPAKVFIVCRPVQPMGPTTAVALHTELSMALVLAAQICAKPAQVAARR